WAKVQAETSMVAKDAFLANMSHELRTPLTVVLGNSELLMENALEPDQHQLVETIHGSSTQLLGIINDILEYSKNESGRLELALEDFDLVDLVRTTCSPLLSLAASKGLAYEVQLDPELPRWVSGDARRIAKIISNLVSNAVKFTERGFVRIHGRADKSGAHRAAAKSTARPKAASKRAEMAPHSVRFEVRDSGMGIAKEAADRLFQPFSWGDPSTTRRHGGTGLGLVIAKQLVELMGGSIGFEPASSGGSLFWFTLPLSRSSKGADESAASGRRSGARAPLRRVLLAEDNPFNQVLVTQVLHSLPCKVDVVTTGQQAVSAALTGSYHLVLMDYQMPDTDGLEATRQIRVREPAGGRIPIIALTASAMSGDREKCLAAGADEYVAKPFSVADLRVVVQRWLDPEPVRIVEAEPASAAAPSSKPRSGRGKRRKPASAEQLRVPVDTSRLQALLDDGGTREMIVELSQIFLSDVAERLATLALAAEPPNWEELRRQAHAVKGACGNFGAVRMADQASELLHSVEKRKDSQLVSRIRELRAELSRVQDFLRANVLSVATPTLRSPSSSSAPAVGAVS
ncbi:MAG TPA: response regulator, partial [Polyangiaceae bacterium]